MKYLDLGPQVPALRTFFSLNVGLAVFNLMPIPPLDGSHLWPVLMPRSWRPAYDRLLPWGTIVLLALMFWPGGDRWLGRLVHTGAILIWNLLP
jgi:Zn-dependent protease